MTSPIWGSILGSVLTFFGERTHVYFDYKNFAIERQLFNLRYGNHKRDINKIYGVYLSKEGDVYKVNIRAENRTYCLGGALGESESAWLAQEIQDWLNPR